jgi:hypothetical protein
MFSAAVRRAPPPSAGRCSTGRVAGSGMPGMAVGVVDIALHNVDFL